MSTTIITKPKVEISPHILSQLKTQTEELGQVIIHFIYITPVFFTDAKIRIWPTSYLYDHHSDHRSELVHAENITYYPEWQQCDPGVSNYFTLIFSGLPKSCTIFDFIEHCDNNWGAFEVRNIARNESDVYYVKIF